MPFTRVTLETSSPVTSSKTQRSAQDLPVKDVPFVKAMVTDPKVFPAASVHLPGPQGQWRTRLGSPQSMKVKVGEEEGVDVGLAVGRVVAIDGLEVGLVGDMDGFGVATAGEAVGVSDGL